MCFPLINQGQLSGIVYLENNLTTGVFAPDRLEVLKLLSSQATISIENARLYQNLEDKAVITATVETFVPLKRRLKDKNGSLPRASDHCETTPVVRMRKILVCLL